MKLLRPGVYEITNKKTGLTKIVKEEELPQYGLAPSTQEEGKSIEGFLENLKGNAVGIPEGIGAGAMDWGQKLASGEKTTSELQAETLFSMLKGVGSDAISFASDPLDFMYERPIDTALYAYPGFKAAKVGAKGAVGTTKFAVSPKKYVSGKIDAKVAKAGVAKPELIRKYFGTETVPNENILKGVATGENFGKYIKRLRKEIVGMEPQAGTGEVPFTKIQDYRKAAGTKGYGAVGSDVPYSRNLQRAYSDLLKEGAGTGGLDNLYNVLAKTQSGVKKAVLPAGGIGLGYLLLQKLFGK